MGEVKLKSGKAVLIRQAERSDAGQILQYIETISGESDFLTFGPGEFAIGIEQEEQLLESTAKQTNALYIVAEVENKIVGSLIFSAGKRPRTVHVGDFSVSVLKEYWGNGIGTELITYLIGWSKRSGVIRKINLVVRNDNFPAINLYKRLGFVEEGMITRNLRINGRFYDSLLMGYVIDR